MNERKTIKSKPLQTDLYTLDELCRAEKRMGASYDVIHAALMEKNVHLASIEEAKAIIDAFKTRTVK